jgi:hypothetical protein
MVQMVTVIQTMVTWTAVRLWKANVHFPELSRTTLNYQPLVGERKPGHRLGGHTADTTQNGSTVCEWATMAMLVLSL